MINADFFSPVTIILIIIIVIGYFVVKGLGKRKG